MPTEVLNQLRALRESVAESLRKDPRYLTLTAIDKSIAEITGVLAASGIAPGEPGSRPPLEFEQSHSAPAAQASEPPARNLSAAAAPLIAEPVSAASATAVAASVAADKPPEAPPVSEIPKPSEGPPPVEHEAVGEPAQAKEGPPLPFDEPSSADEVVADGASSGYLPMQAREGASHYQPAVSVRYGKLPNKVDLRPLMTSVEHQGETNSCVANAVASAYEYAIKKSTKRDHALSRLFVYYNARWRDGAQDSDGGSAIQLAMDGVCKFGACSEAAWPFVEAQVTDRPGADAYRDAQPWRAQDMAKVPLKLEAWKQALAEGRPIVFGITLFDSFLNCSDRGGVVDMPAPDRIASLGHGGHAMCAVGYSETERVFIVRNCWGADWGDWGYCYMPYAYLLNPKFNGGDAWTLLTKGTGQPPRDAWFDDHRPITNDGKGVDFPIEPFSIDDYADVPFGPLDPGRPFNSVVGEDFARYASLAEQGKWDAMEQRDTRTSAAIAAALDADSLLADPISPSPDEESDHKG